MKKHPCSLQCLRSLKLCLSCKRLHTKQQQYLLITFSQSGVLCRDRRNGRAWCHSPCSSFIWLCQSGWELPWCFHSTLQVPYLVSHGSCDGLHLFRRKYYSLLWSLMPGFNTCTQFFLFFYIWVYFSSVTIKGNKVIKEKKIATFCHMLKEYRISTTKIHLVMQVSWYFWCCWNIDFASEVLEEC